MSAGHHTVPLGQGVRLEATQRIQLENPDADAGR